jgi:hypothetical protein
MLSALWAPTALCADTPGAGESPGFSGYYKNLLIRSKTLTDEHTGYAFDVNRLRLEKQGQLTDDLRFDIQYDNEVLFGNYLGTGQFQAQKSLPTGQYWDLENTYHDSASAFARQRIYRGYLTWSSGATDVRLGRQRIAWGSGKFWSPFDVLNPVDPTALEREERTGLDSLLVERRLSAVSRISAVYAPQRVHGGDALAFQWHGNKAGIDFSLMAMRFMRARVVGVELTGQAGGAGLRAEFTRTLPERAPAHTRVVLGVDYAFENTLALTGELYYNGAGARDRQHYDFASLSAGRIQSVARHYAGAHAAYDITPLLKLNVHLVANLDDGSRFIAPSATYSWKTNLDLTFGMQYAGGSGGSEFGHFQKVFYLQLQRYF